MSAHAELEIFLDRIHQNRTSPERTSPERTSPERTSPERTSPERTSPERTRFETFSAQFRVSLPNQDADNAVQATGLTLDLSRPLDAELRPAEVGARLRDLLFSTPVLSRAFSRARGAGVPLRIRLSFGPGAADLHSLPWETLRDPEVSDPSDASGPPLVNDHRIYFSRYLSSFDWRPVRLRPREQLRALIFIANPEDLAELALAEVPVKEELDRAKRGLGDIPSTALYSGAPSASTAETSPPASPAPVRASLQRLMEALHEGYDILYLVCHGGVNREGRAMLYLEGEDGRTNPIAGETLVQRLNDLEVRPRLVVLASCQSAGSADPYAINSPVMLALGPRLAGAGIPAVLAMQGNVHMRTVEQFMPLFFRELATDGIIDRAMAVARGAISDPREAWRPLLFMRLKQGRIWYDAGFSNPQSSLKNWAGLRNRIKQLKCTPLIGPGLLESLFEYRPWLARRWAQEHGFPLAPGEREDLTAVAQFVANIQYATYPHEQLEEELIEGVRQRLSSSGTRTGAAESSLSGQLQMLRARRFAGRTDPYRVLAELPLPIYILAAPDPLLALAIGEVELNGKKRQPRVAALSWRPDLQGLLDPFDEDPDYEPSPEEPLIYQLLGTLDQPESLVLTQDNYFDYLLSIQKKEIRETIPNLIFNRLVDSSLLFLGFQFDSWEFRTLFRIIMQQEGRASLGRHPHVAAQLEPEDGRVLDPAGAQAYLQRYFAQSRIDLYWGTVEHFLAALKREMEGTRR